MPLPRVDFYHLPNDQERQLQLFCCRLTEKAWRLNNRIFIMVPDAATAQRMDTLLWTYRDDGFLPHEVVGQMTETPAQSAILIGEQLPEEQHFDLLINLAQALPTDIESISDKIARIAEIINQNPNRKQQGRIRYSYYDKNNYSLEYHEITAG